MTADNSVAEATQQQKTWTTNENIEERSDKQIFKEQSQNFNELTRPIRGYLRLGVVLSAISAVLAIAPYAGVVKIGQILLDSYSKNNQINANELWLIVGLIVVSLGLSLGLFSIALIITHIADRKFGHYLRLRVIDVLAQVPLNWFSESTSGAIRKTVQNDSHDLHYLIAHQKVEYTAALVKPLAALAYALWIDWRLGLLAVLVVPFYLASQAYFMKDSSKKSLVMQEKLGIISMRIVEFIKGITVVKAFGKTGETHSRFKEASDDFIKFYWEWAQPMLKASAISESLITPATLLFINLSVGGAMVIAGWVSTFDLIATTLISLILPATINAFFQAMWAKQVATIAAKNIMNVIKTEALPEAKNPKIPQNNMVSYRNVSFSYGNTLAIDNVSFELATNSVTALVGLSGSGKSTLATLLARFNDPDSGAISIGGIDLRNISTEELYRRVAFVLQDAQLLNISLADNIRLARPDASMAEVRQAGDKAKCSEFVNELEKGYDTIYGVGTNLSGGQQQRIAIARALLADTPILILDEATAFADPESEAAIQEALSKLVKGRTVLVIAHRVSAIVNADQVIYLDHGKLKGRGKHQELLSMPEYAALWTSK